MVSGVLVTSRHIQPTKWSRMQQVGYAGEGGLRGGRGGASTTTAPNPPQAQAATQPPPTPLKKTFERTIRLQVRLAEQQRGDPPWQKAQHPPTPHRMAYEGRRRPQTHHPWYTLDHQSRSSLEPARAARTKKRGGYPPTRGGGGLRCLTWTPISILGGPKRFFSQFY